MKNMILSAFAAVSLLAASASFASPAEPSGCSLHFAVHIDSILIFSSGTGTGLVTCSSASGVSKTANVNIEIKGIGLGLGTFDVQGIAGGIGILNPEDIAGTYAVLGADVGLGGAAGASLGFEGQANGLSFTGSVQGGHGVGVMLNGTAWTITPAN